MLVSIRSLVIRKDVKQLKISIYERVVDAKSISQNRPVRVVGHTHTGSPLSMRQPPPLQSGRSPTHSRLGVVVDGVNDAGDVSGTLHCLPIKPVPVQLQSLSTLSTKRHTPPFLQ